MLGWASFFFSLSALSLSIALLCVPDEATVFSRVYSMNLDMDGLAMDAACSWGSNPGRFIAIRDLPPELCIPLFHAEFIASSWKWMGLIDAVFLEWDGCLSRYA
eukprot:scaffold16358_cov54-Attheya_sp.AAC.3